MNKRVCDNRLSCCPWLVSVAGVFTSHSDGYPIQNATIRFSHLSYRQYHYMISRINPYFRLSSFLVVLFLISCDKNEYIHLSPTEKAIAATWVYEGFDNGIYEYSRAIRLAEDREGWIFHANGKLTDRKNSGFCGTPPITYENYKGNWEVGSDSRVQLNSKSWAGDVKYKLEIVSVSSDRLLVRVKY